jgi:outer membrane protein assembly factor BamB
MKRSFRFLSSASLLVALSIGAATAFGDWPQWRGIDRDGHSTDTGLLKQWPAGGPKLVWKATGLGGGYAGPSVAGDRVFVVGDLGDSNYLMALGRSDGKLVWKTKVGKAGSIGMPPWDGPRCTPTVGDNKVVAVGQFGEVLCADAATGAALWRKDCMADFGGKRPLYGYCGMPLVDGDNVILIPGGGQGDLVALNGKTGELVWRSKELTDAINHSSPLLVEIGGVRQIILFSDGSVAGVQASDGHLLWRAARKGAMAVVPTPIYHDNQVYVTAGYGAGCNLYKITANQGKFSAAQSYANTVMVNHHGGVVLVGKYVYGYSDAKGWTCQNLETGEAVWQESKKLGKGSLAYADGLLYLRAEAGKGTVAIIEATPDGYKELSRFDPPDRSKKNSWAHPVISDGRLYLRDQDILQCYDLQGK